MLKARLLNNKRLKSLPLDFKSPVSSLDVDSEEAKKKAQEKKD